MKRQIRQIQERWLITGILELTSPTSLSNGDDDPSVALPLLTDPYDGRPLLTGASLAGALRSYVRRYYGDEGQVKAALLFGGAKQDPDGEQSPLIVEDALGVSAEVNIEIRDGVRIDPSTRTAADGAKYDRQLLAAGTQFKIGFELLLTKDMDKVQLAEILAVALQGLASGKIALGGRKRRGYGECKVVQWQVWQYDLATPKGVRGWLGHGRANVDHPVTPQVGGAIALLLNEKPSLPDSHANELELTATFEVDGSVLIRAGFEQEKAPEMAHLTSWCMNEEGQPELMPILSGTSLAGVIRAQAHRIARTVHGESPASDQAINDLFGYNNMPRQAHETKGKSTEAINKLRRASRVTVREVAIEGGQSLVQSRVAIDRFTGGALESALFEQQPHFGGRFTLRLQVRNPKPEEIGLLLLVLKDLWTGFTPIGGESSVGRGRLKGVAATLRYQENSWQLKRDGQQLAIPTGDPAVLEGYVAQFVGGGK